MMSWRLKPLLLAGSFLVMTMAGLLLAAMPDTVWAAGETYKRNGGTITITGGDANGTVSKQDRSMPAGQELFTGSIYISSKSCSMNLGITVTGTSGKISATKYTGPPIGGTNAGNTGGITPNTPSDCDTSVYNSYNGQTVSITTDSTAPTPPETDAQKAVFIKVDTAIQGSYDSMPASSTATLKDSNGQTLKTVTLMKRVKAGGSGGSGGFVEYSNQPTDGWGGDSVLLTAGNYSVCLNDFTKACQNFEKVPNVYKDVVFDLGGTASAGKIIFVTVKMDTSTIANDKTIPPQTITLYDAAGTQLTTAQTDSQPVKSTSDIANSANGTITVVELHGQFANVEPGQYKVCYKDTTTCADVTKDSATNPTVTLTLTSDQASALLNEDSGEDSFVDCGSGGFNFFVCPALKLALAAGAKVDSFIMHQLDVDATAIFDDTSNPDSPSYGYYKAWSQFRIIATSLLIIGGLVMVVSTALGFEFLDAYTIRKTLPRLLIAIIGISLSWPLMKLCVNFFDTVGFDIRAIMYAPFQNMSGHVGVGTGILSSFVVGVGLFAFGPTALTFILTACLALFVGFLILVIRQAAIIMLVILAPVAIACFILPNTQRVWKLWSDNFFGLLLMFPIISALIAAGHIFAAVTVSSNQGDSPAAVIAQAIAIIAYFIPYFLLPMAARLATGLIGNLAGFVNDRHKGAFDRLKVARDNSRQKRHAARMAGQTAFGSSKAGSWYRRGASLGDPNSGAANVFNSAKYKEYERKHLAHASDEMLKNDNGRWAGDDDANWLAAKGYKGREFTDAYAMRRAAAANREVNSEDYKAAQAALGGLESSYGAKMGSEAMKVTAYKAWAGSTTGAAIREKGWEQRREIGAEMVKEGLMTSTDVAAALKGNQKRGDGSGAGFGKMIQYFDAAAKGQYAYDGTTQMNEEYMLRNALHGSGPGERLGGHLNTVKSFSEITYKDFMAAPAGSDEQIELAAEIMGTHNALSQVSKEKADVWARDVMLQPSGHMGKDADGNDVELNVQQYTNSLRSNPILQARSREYEQQAIMGIQQFNNQQASQQAYQQAVQQGIQQAMQGGPPGGAPGGGLGPFRSDRRLKRDVAELAKTTSGIQLYRFKYLWSDQEYVGVMAQDLLETHPEAVIIDELGFYKVRYDILGLKLYTIEEWQEQTRETLIR